MPGTPLALTLPLVLVLLLLAVGAAYHARAGQAGSLRRGGRWGVRTAAASRSDAAFALANRVAAPVLAGAAVVGLLGAVLLVAVSIPVAASLVIAAIALVGLVALSVIGTTLGERAARTLPVPARRPGNAGGASCGGCGCGSGGCAGLTRTADSPGPAAQS